MSALIVIPARMGSTRLAEKPLRLLRGRPLVLWAHEAAVRSAVGRVVVATDDERIRVVVEAEGGEAALTSPHHRTGTDRVAEVARNSSEAVVLNLQGDEPDADPGLIRRIAEACEAGEGMVTAAAEITDPAAALSPQVVKVVVGADARALYFSRAQIPAAHPGHAGPLPRPLGHLGIYGFRRETLLRFVELPPGRLEVAEGLEQLRALENGIPILVLMAARLSRGVDTEEDLARYEKGSH